MSSYWTLHVKDFAKIKEAHIDAAPLVLFVGDNNSNKSYLLSLLWGLTRGILPQYFGDVCESNESLVVQAMLNSRFTGEASEGFYINEEEHHACIDRFNSLLTTNISPFIRQIFNSEIIQIGAVSLTVPFQAGCLANRTYTSIANPVVRDAPPQQQLQYTIQHHGSNGSVGFSPTQQTATDFSVFYTGLCLHYRNVFLPAPRTGFLLTHETLAETMFSRFGIEKQGNSESLTAPQISFLQNLIRKKQMIIPTALAPIIHFIEKDVINGSIEIVEDSSRALVYRQNGLGFDLPLNLSSGVVSEVAGLLCILKFSGFSPICIFEEPETCLHPALQQKMARILIKMVNAGITVWASTHSTDIIQHVNNMIKLYNHPNSEQLREEHKYCKDDVIAPEKVRMYQFKVDSDDKTTVTSLIPGVNGFPVPTFGNILRKSRDEVLAFYIDGEEN